MKNCILCLQLCLALLLVSASCAEEKESSTKSKAIPLEKKLDKRGLLNLGYGYGINGLDVGYIGGGHHGGAYHHAAPLIESSPYQHQYGGGYHQQHNGYQQQYNGYHQSGPSIYLGHKTDVQKTVTVLKGYPVPYEVKRLNFFKELRILNLFDFSINS